MDEPRSSQDERQEQELDESRVEGAEAAEDQGPPELAEEAELGSTPAGVATNKSLRALSRAARSFLLYDPTNDAIRVFLADYRDAMKSALEHGAMVLEIRPFEMVRETEIV